DPALRPSFDKPEETELTELIRRLAKAHRECKALCYGDLKVPVLTNKQCVIQRDFDGERVFIAINADDQPFWAHFDAGYGLADDLVTGTVHDFGGGSEIAPMSGHIWRCK
ncbi:MAG: cyclomaltodextrinase, partial [Oscillospiraceae bacterium]|nr:cyclomaltodextrinase [Oscillospiraceae bacterium]